MDEITSCIMSSPLGGLKLQASGNVLTAIRFINSSESHSNRELGSESILAVASRQLREYFTGERRNFDLPLSISGTIFEKEVWDRLEKIPWGTTITYAELAKKLGDINKVRAVGRANGQNKLPIIIPCHRVIGAGGKLTGYAGGIERKRWLLKHEGAILL